MSMISFAAAESPRVKDLIWTGSDDGLVQYLNSHPATEERIRRAEEAR